MAGKHALRLVGALTAALLAAGCSEVPVPEADRVPASQVAASATAAPSATAPAAELRDAAGLTTNVTVSRVIDGDTIVTSRGRVRLIGIDTPERGMCGFGPATSQLRRLLPVGSRVTLTKVAGRDNQDRYGRYLRYVSIDGADVGAAMISAGLADARYDSRDGYGWHPKQDAYTSSDAQHADEYTYSNCPSAASSARSTGTDGTYYSSCEAAKAVGAAPVRRGDPGYGPHLDRDGDGVACE